MFPKVFFPLLSLILLLNISAFPKSDLQEKICGYSKLRLFGAKPIKRLSDARNQLNVVLDKAGVLRDSISFSAAALDGQSALACQENGKTIILFAPSELNKLVSAQSNDWGVKSIFAHEAGHHFFNHFIKSGKQKQLELQADEFAGEVLARLGASEQESKNAYQSWIGDKELYREYKVTNYPSPSERILAMRKGWYKSICRNSLQVFKDKLVEIQKDVFHWQKKFQLCDEFEMGSNHQKQVLRYFEFGGGTFVHTTESIGSDGNIDMFSSSIPFYLGVENKKYRLIVAINHALDELDEPGSIHIILFGSEREKADFESIVKNHLKSKLGYYNPNRIKIVKSDKQSDGDFEVSFVPVGGDPPSP